MATVVFGGFVICTPDQHRLPGLCRTAWMGSMAGAGTPGSSAEDPCVQRAGRAICTRTSCSLQLLRNYHKNYAALLQGFSHL